MLLDASSDGENVGIENDVLWRKMDFIDKDPIGSFANADLFIVGGGLAIFIERHDYHRGTVFLDVSRAFFELFFSLLERDRVDDSFALQVFDTFFQNLPFRGIDHDRNFGNVRLALQKLQETCHHRLAIDETIVKANIDHVGTVLDLLACDFESVFEFSCANQFRKRRRSSHVGALADHEEIFVGRVIVRL